MHVDLTGPHCLTLSTASSFSSSLSPQPRVSSEYHGCVKNKTKCPNYFLLFLRHKILRKLKKKKEQRKETEGKQACVPGALRKCPHGVPDCRTELRIFFVLHRA